MKISALIIILFSTTILSQVKVIKDITYALVDEKELKLDLYLPENNPTPFLIIWIHGGAWHSGDKESPPDYLIKNGLAMASVEYRLSIEAPFPAMIYDIKAALRFLRANAENYGYYKEKFTVWGSSAGGHLAALIGTTNNVRELEGNLGDYTDKSSSVQAIIDFYGPTNLLTILNQSTPHGINVRAPALALLLGKPVEQVENLAKLASPVFHVDKSDPPLLIFHGDQDIQVPINQSHELDGAYDAYKLDSELVIVHGGGHTDSIYFEEKYMRKVMDFLDRVFKN